MKESNSKNASLPASITLPDGVTLPEGVVIPDGVDQDMVDAFIQNFQSQQNTLQYNVNRPV